VSGDVLAEAVQQMHRAGVGGVMRFGVPDTRWSQGSDEAHQPGDAEVEQRPARRLAVPREGGQRERPAIVPVCALDARCD
jgi:hypothetical protein